jgi:hypothetical protein
MRVLLLLSISCLLTLSVGRCDVYEIGTSPDGKYLVTLETNKDDALDGIGDLQVRNKTNKELLGTFSYNQYDPIEAPNEAGVHSGMDANIIWKADSRAFAITSQVGKNYDGSAIYALNGEKWLEVEIPDFKLYNPADGWITRHSSSVVASQWLKDEVLLMKFDCDIYRFCNGNVETMPSDYLVYLQLKRGGKGLHFDLLKSEVKNQ